MIISNHNQTAVNKALQALQLKMDYQSLAITERQKAGKPGFSTDLDGGVMFFATPNAMVNIAIGMGIGEPTHAWEGNLVSEITEFYHKRESGVKLETSLLARPGFLAAVFQAGYQVVEVNNIYHQSGNEVSLSQMPHISLANEYTIDEVDATVPDFQELISVTLIGYGISPAPELVSFYYDWLCLPGQRKWAIRYKGKVVGSFSLLVMDHRAYFSGASIKEAHRGKGLHHHAMLTRFAALQTTPQVQDNYFTASHCSVSAVNAERFGFKQIDTRLAWRLARPM